MTAIEFNNISKQYRLGLVSTKTLSNDLNRWFQMNVKGKEDPYLKIGSVNDRSTTADSDYVWALRNVDFKVEQGDVVGIIGKNGAGKSTLLKILSKVTAPTTGTIRAKGRIASLLEVGTGFHPEMTGRENIYMNGAIMGMTKAEIARKIDEIIDFSGCERYIDTPVKRYSSGMTVRLGFAIAAHLDPEILVVDEVLAVGDAEFQKKAIGKMQEVSKGDGRTVLFVSHNMGSMLQLCKNGILLSNGTVEYIGSISDTVNRYLESNNTGASKTYFSVEKNSSLVYLHSMHMKNEQGELAGSFYTKDKIRMELQLKYNSPLPNAEILITIVSSNSVRIASLNEKLKGRDSINLEISAFFLVRGNYSITVHLYQPGSAPYEVVDSICHFEVIDSGTSLSHLETFDYGLVFPKMQCIE